MKKIVMFAAALLLSLGASQVMAGEDCALNYTRTACKGQETMSYKKCGGKQSCTKDVEASSAEECATMATKACANDRLDITKSKVITASFKGKALKTKGGKDDFCTEYENRDKEFNQCQ